MQTPERLFLASNSTAELPHVQSSAAWQLTDDSQFWYQFSQYWEKHLLFCPCWKCLDSWQRVQRSLNVKTACQWWSFCRSNFRCDITRRRFQQEVEISEYYEYRFMDLNRCQNCLTKVVASVARGWLIILNIIISAATLLGSPNYCTTGLRMFFILHNWRVYPIIFCKMF